MDSTFSSSIFFKQFDVSGISPRSSPRILNDVVVFSVIRSVSDGKNSVIKSGSTFVGEDSRFVELEPETRGIDGNRDGVDLEGSNHL